MEENISTIAKIAVTCMLLGIAFGIIIVVSNVTLQMHRSVIEPVYLAQGDLGKNIYAISLEESIPAPVAYKVFRQNEEYIQSIKITIGGVQYIGLSNVDKLLKNAGKNVKVTITKTYAGNKYDLIVVEVG